jgi:hypothetical protein
LPLTVGSLTKYSKGEFILIDKSEPLLEIRSYKWS